MIKPIDILFSFTILMTILRSTLIFADAKKMSGKKKGKLYKAICNSLNIDHISIANRPEEMQLAFNQRLTYITPESCMNFGSKEQIDEECEEDLSAVSANYKKHYSRLDVARELLNDFDREVFTKEYGEALKEEVGKENAKVLNMRNRFFLTFAFLQAYNVGMCNEICSYVYHEFNQQLAMKKLNWPIEARIVLVDSLKEKFTELPNLPDLTELTDDDNAVVTSHVFFLIDSNLAVGAHWFSDKNWENFTDPNSLKGWVCDPWNDEFVFGKFKSVAKKDPIYNLRNWREVKVYKADFPNFIGDEDQSDIYEKHDYFTNPSLFFNALEAHPNLAARIGAEDVKVIKNALEPTKKQREGLSEDHKEL